jgi:hypothetical protein
MTTNMGVILMKKEYIQYCLEELNKNEKSSKKNARVEGIFSGLFTVFAAASAIMIFPFNPTSSYTLAALGAILAYQVVNIPRLTRPILKRINNERNHLQELVFQNPANSKELYGRRMTKLRELAQARNKKSDENKTAEKYYARLTMATGIATGVSYFWPFMIPATIALGISMMIAGEQNVKYNRQVEELTNRKNNLDNDISVLQEYEKDVKNAQRQREAQISRQRQVPQRQTTYRGTPKAAAKTANESMVNQYLVQMSHPVVRETAKQKIK